MKGRWTLNKRETEVSRFDIFGLLFFSDYINAEDIAAEPEDFLKFLVNTPNMGYGLKKANMFIRDMVELKVWSALENFDKIDVASDINTMKLALRTRIYRALFLYCPVSWTCSVTNTDS